MNCSEVQRLMVWGLKGGETFAVDIGLRVGNLGGTTCTYMLEDGCPPLEEKSMVVV